MDDQLELLLSEYKILQEKIDKIGGFGFTVKGWCVTLVIASIFAVGANTNAPAQYLLLLLPFVTLFFLLELRQDKLSYRFGKRVLELENSIRRVRATQPSQKTGARLVYVPGIANHLHRWHANKPRGAVLGWVMWVLHIDRSFYLVQVIMILVAVWLLSNRSSVVMDAPSSITVIENSDSSPSTVR